MILIVTTGKMTMFAAALVAAGLMVLTGCCRAESALSAVNVQVLLVIATAIGVGKAMHASALDQVLATQLLSTTGVHPSIALAVAFTVTMLLAAVITAKAAVVIVLPIYQVVAQQLDVSFMPFVMVVLIAAATTIATPIGYPTNLIVMGPGGYRSRDYFAVGAPLTVLIGVLSVALIPLIWPYSIAK